MSTLTIAAGPEILAPELHARAALIRGVEQRLLDLFAQGKLFGTVHTCIGQEWTGVAVAESLVEGDVIFSNHRGHGHFLAHTDDVDGLIAEVMGKQSGICGGRGGSQHMCSGGVYSNGVQGGIVPVAAGMALALPNAAGTGKIAVVFIGDGTLGEGAIYEAFNVASKWNLPLLIVLENNRYSQSTAQEQTLAGDIEARASAFGIGTARGETWDPADLVATASKCVREVREGQGPRFLRIDTYRLMAHSKGDDDRDRTEVDAYWGRDPIAQFARDQPATAEAFEAESKRRIDEAVARADLAPYTAPTPPEPLPEGPLSWTRAAIAEPDRVNARIHAALRRNMAKDGRIFLIGEDIEGPYGGAFKVTKDLSLEFPGRVRNMPIAESAIVGLGNGLALMGEIPVCEIMFGDFLTLAADQLLNHASKFRYMFNDQVTQRLIVRTPMGGKRGYGATHSQSLEKHFLGMPGTRVLAVHHRLDPASVYDALFATIDRPTIVIENKLVYGLRTGDTAPSGFALEHSNEAFPTTRIRPEGRADVTILCYGGMLVDVEKALEPLFDQDEIACEVICPTQLYPLDMRPILDSVERTGRLVIAEEGIGFAAFGAEVVAQILERSPGALRGLKRVSSPEHPIPSCGPLEKEILPGMGHVVEAARELCSR